MFQRRLGYSVAATEICTFDSFLNFSVGKSFSCLCIRVDNSELTHLRIKVLDEALSRTKKRFLELEISNAEVSKIEEVLNFLYKLRPHKIIICLNPSANVSTLKNLIDSFLLHDIWVETKGVPYCNTYIEHVWENYNEVDELFDKETRCVGCSLLEECRRIDTRLFSSVKPVGVVKGIEDFKRFMQE